MKLLVLGTTGPCGIFTCQYALQAGHKLVVYRYDDVEVFQGQLTDLPLLRGALSGCDVLSSLGPAVTRDRATLPITDGYRVILEAMRTEGIKRIIALGTTSIDGPFDVATWTSRFVAWLINTIGPGSYKDVLALGDLISRADDLDWTIVVTIFNFEARKFVYHWLYRGWESRMVPQA